MNGLKLFVLVIILMLLVGIGWVCQAALGLQKTVLDINYYEGLVEKVELSAHIEQILKHSLEKAGAGAPLTEEENPLAGAIFEVFHADWLEEQLLKALEGYIGLLKGKSDPALLTIDLRDRREALRGKIEGLLPAMSEEQQAELGLTGSGAAQDWDQFFDHLGIPEQLSLGEMLDEETVHNIEQVRRAQRISRYLPYLIAAVLALFCFLLAGWAGGFKWLGAGLLTSGMTYLGLLLSARFVIIAPLLTASIQVGSLPLPEETVLEILLTVMRFTSNRLLLITMLFSALGAVLVIAGVILGRAAASSTTPVKR